MNQKDKEKILTVLDLSRQVMEIALKSSYEGCPEEYKHIVHCKNLQTRAQMDEVVAIVESEECPDNPKGVVIN